MERPRAQPVINSIRQDLENLRASGLWRTRRVVTGPQGPLVSVNGQETVNFSSNDYLGLAGHPRLQAALQEGAARHGVGSGASQLVCGYSRAHQELEEKLCRLTGRDRALVFSSGYLANQAMVTALTGKDDDIIGDRLNHASMIDAALLSRARFRRYRHVDTVALKRLLATAGKHRCLVTTDAVFSMDGDIAPLASIAEICEASGTLLAVDDAHGFGVLGTNGMGTLSHSGLPATAVPLVMATFGKALGTFGAFVAGDAVLIEKILQAGRSLIYSTALPPALAQTTSVALDLLQEESWRRVVLQDRIEQFRRGAKERQLPVLPSETAIQPVLIGDPQRAVAISDKLLAKGFLVVAIRPPTVPRNTSRLRIVLSAAHTEKQVAQLLDLLAEVI